MVDWSVEDLEPTVESDSGVDPDIEGFLGNNRLTTLGALREFHSGEKSLPEVSEALDIDYQNLYAKDLEEKGFVLNVDEGRPNLYTTSMEGDNLLAKFDLIELGGRDKLVRNIVHTFEDNPESLKSLDRVGVDDDWSSMVDRLKAKYSSENQENKIYRDLGGKISIPLVQNAIDRLRSINLGLDHGRNLENGEEEVFDERYNGSDGSLDVEEVVEDFDIFDGELDDFNYFVEEESIQVSELRSVHDGFYAIDIEGDPWYVDESDVPPSLDLENDKAVLSKDSSHNVTRLPRGVVEGYFDSETEEYREV